MGDATWSRSQEPLRPPRRRDQRSRGQSQQRGSQRPVRSRIFVTADWYLPPRADGSVRNQRHDLVTAQLLGDQNLFVMLARQRYEPTAHYRRAHHRRSP